MTRKHKMTFRLNDEELVKINGLIRRSGMNQQKYLLHAVLHQKILNTDGIQAILPELKAQGNNLNQIAYRLNSGQNIHQLSFDSTMKEVKSVWRQLRLLLQAEVLRQS